MFYIIEQNKETLIESETGKAIPTQDEKPSMGCVDSVYFLVRKVSRFKARSYVA